MPNFDLEWNAGAEAGKMIVGVDEVGRGPLAGPVVSAAVLIPTELLGSRLLKEINDSKKLTAAKRETLAPVLRSCCHFGIGVAEVEEIDRVNVLQATYLAMSRAVDALSRDLGQEPDLCLIDGNRLPPELPVPAESVVKGDSKSISIAAASIIAKVHRDALMACLAKTCPGYGWERNAGYGTAEHLSALETLGVTPHHRRSFRPVRDALFADGTSA